MADLNEPKKETERIGLPPLAGAKPTPASFTPPSPPSVAPRHLPPKEEVVAGPRPVRPTVRPSAPAASGAARPPNGPPASTSVKALDPTPPPAGLPPSPNPGALSPGAPGSSKPVLSSLNRPLENRGLFQTEGQETGSGADSSTKVAAKPGRVRPSSVPSVPIIRAALPAVANSPVKGLRALAPAQLCWALLGISVLTLLMQLWNYFS